MDSDGCDDGRVDVNGVEDESDWTCWRADGTKGGLREKRSVIGTEGTTVTLRISLGALRSTSDLL